MAVSAKLYGKFFQSAFNKEIDIDSDTIKAMLCTSTYIPDQDVHRYKSDVTGEVAAGNGYATNGATVTGVTVSYNSSTNTLSFTGANLSWPNSTFVCRYLVLYDSSPSTDATRPLIGYVDFGQDMNPVNGTLSVTWDAAGIASVTVG